MSYPGTSDVSLRETWDKLKDGVDQIMMHVDSGLSYGSYMEMYTLIYNYCTSSRMTGSQEALGGAASRGANLMGSDLYNNLKEYLKSHLANLKRESENYMDEQLLVYYTKQWSQYTTAGTLVHHIFGYLNRHWVKREIDEGHKSIYDIYTLTLVSWRDHLFNAIHQKVMNAVLKQIEKQRDGEQIDAGLIKKVVESFVSLGLDDSDSKKTTLDVYVQFFQGPFIEATEQYYQVESDQHIVKNSVMEYMKKAEARLLEEERRVDLYLHTSTKKPLLAKCESVLVARHAPRMQEEFTVLLEQDKLEDLTRMYGLLCRIPETLEKLRAEFEKHVRERGIVKVQAVVAQASTKEAAGGDDDDEDEAPKKKPVKKPGSKKKEDAGPDVDAKDYVEALLEVHKKYDEWVQSAFKGEAGFVASLDKACREFVNRNAVCVSRTTKTPELLAKYCDTLLKKTSKAHGETGKVESLLNQVMTVFKYVEDKDVFQRFYSQALSRRLVFSLSASEDAEESMISKLKEACGSDYTTKIQRMFQDIGVSEDMQEVFKGSIANSGPELQIDFPILVLSSHSWPLQAPKSPFNLPLELQPIYTRFKAYYNEKHAGRRLTWLFQLSRLDLKAIFKANKSPYTLTVPTYAAAILLHYNNGLSYSWEELQQVTGLDDETLKQTISPFVAKFKVLLQTSGQKIGPDARFDLNENFASKRVKIQMTAQGAKEAKAEREDTHKMIEGDRELVIQAAIVRVMKARKVLRHNNLISEVVQQLAHRFKPEISMIKQQIDVLMVKDYIERSEEERDLLRYLA